MVVTPEVRVHVDPVEMRSGPWRTFVSALPIVAGRSDPGRLSGIALAAAHVPAHLLMLEPRLLLKKWPAYRFIGPWEATALYAETYRDAYRHNFGIPLSFDVTPGSAAFIALWMMRQGADSLRMPYADSLRIAFSMNRRNPKPFASPHKRFNDLNRHRTFGQKAWKERGALNCKLLGNEMGDQYRVEAFANLPAQRNFREVVIGSGGKTQEWSALVRDAVVRRRLVPVRALAGLMDPRTKNSVIEELEFEVKYRGLKPEPFRAVVAHELWPSCYGVPGAYQGEREPCLRCPAAKDCIALGRQMTLT
jgi:hypothetical protein